MCNSTPLVVALLQTAADVSLAFAELFLQMPTTGTYQSKKTIVPVGCIQVSECRESITFNFRFRGEFDSVGDFREAQRA